MNTPARTIAVAVAIAVASSGAPLRAQQPAAGGKTDTGRATRQQRRPAQTPEEVRQFGRLTMIARDDYYETHVQDGFQVEWPALDMTIRGERLLLLNDLESTIGAVERGGRRGLPRRGIARPPSRRSVSTEELRRRLQRTMLALGNGGTIAQDQLPDDALRTFRYFYCEGGIVVIKDGVEVLRCSRLWISPIDDRIVVEDAELRYATSTGPNRQTLVVRGPKLIKQGRRWIGEDLELTTCTAAEPHAALAVAEAEIIERDGEFEVISRGQSLKVGGASILPLPDARVFTGSQSQFPVKSASAGYSGNLGSQLGVLFGLPWNSTGGRLHHWLTGRPEQEFRGEWEFGVGWIEHRGVPLEGALEYRADGVYEGRTEAFFLSDTGDNLREIQRNIDGSAITDDSRGVIRSQNRVHLDDKTHLDLVAFHGTDAAVFSEFFVGPYRNQEVPETSAYLHHADGNHLLTLGGRFNLSDWSYRDDRYLATRFVEELPVMTYQWLAQPIAETPWHTPIVIDLETQVGQRRSDYDDRIPGARISDRRLRADQHVEVSTPFQLGALMLRPYVSGRGTYYDRTIAGDNSEARVAFEGGVQVGTRLSRTFRWWDEAGARSSARHVIAPLLTYRNRFHVDDQPGSFFQFDNVDPLRLYRLGYDSIDALAERELVRFEVRNLFQRMVGEGDRRQPHNFLSVDVAQDLYPQSRRDNNGEQLGLLFYDLLLQPRLDWMPLDRFALGFYGDHDWRQGMQTLDTELQFGQVLGIDWTVEYRDDAVVDGALGLGGSARLFDRWALFAGAQRDMGLDEWLSYAFSVQRQDHDWAISLSAAYNPFSNETTFRIDFQPSFGVGSARRDRWVQSNVQDRFAYDY